MDEAVKYRSPDRSLQPTVIATVIAATLLVVTACNNEDSMSPGPTGSAPVADASSTPTEGLTIGTVAVLDGTASSDPDGDSLTYQWSLLSTPAGSSTTEVLMAQDSIATIALDLEGSYSAMLVVSDGSFSSAPDTVDLTAMRGAPRVGMDEFEGARTFGDFTFVLEQMLTVTGPVDDSSATVTVNGTGATVTGTRYSADVSLVTGSNDIVVVAQNPAGSSSVSGSVTYVGLGASLRVTSPVGLYGVVLDGDAPVPTGPLPVTVRGLVTVSLGAPTPVVNVNGSPATVTALSVPCVVAKCFRFEADVSMPKGPGVVSATSGVLTSTTTPVIDYCLERNRHPGVVSEVGNQGSRCHEIDGCSVYLSESGLLARLDLRNDPMASISLAVRNQASTEFGSGVAPPEEFFVHGLSPARDLPCNNHDVCYQTLGTTQNQCDDQMYREMQEVCFRAYPPGTFAPREEALCYSWAWVYYTGLRAAGGPTFDERQQEYGIG